MATKTRERPSIRSMISNGWRMIAIALAGVAALAVYVGLSVAENPYVALVASTAIGPLLILPMTRRVVWLVLACVAGVALTAALMWTLG